MEKKALKPLTRKERKLESRDQYKTPRAIIVIEEVETKHYEILEWQRACMKGIIT